MHHFYCEHISRAGERAVLDERDTRHLFKTLRARPGECIGLMDGCGITALAVIREGREILVESVERHSPPPVRIHLFVAAARKQKMDQLLKQSAEIGVWSINPIICERSVATPGKVGDRWKQLLTEGCKQSGNPYLPELAAPLDLPMALSGIAAAGFSGYYGAVAASGSGIAVKDQADVVWATGPEGGFTPAEEQSMCAVGLRPLNIGPYIMRIETAAVCGAALLMSNAIMKGSV